MNKSRNMCVIYTETNGLHSSNNDITKKNLFEFARLVVLNYEIGYRENDKFITTKKIRSIIKPRCMIITQETTNIHGITMEQAINEGTEIETVLDIFVKDIADTSIIVSHNINFHLKTLLGEFIRYNKPFSFSNFIIIDTISFFHNFNYPKLDYLYNELYKKKNTKKLSNLEIIRLCFLKLYSDYENTIP